MIKTNLVVSWILNVWWFITIDSKLLRMVSKLKKFDEEKKSKMTTEIVQILNFFIRNDFWYTGIQIPRFCKWPWNLNWSKWIDIQTQILLTIIGSTDSSSRFDEIGHLRNSAHQFGQFTQFNCRGHLYEMPWRRSYNNNSTFVKIYASAMWLTCLKW